MKIFRPAALAVFSFEFLRIKDKSNFGDDVWLLVQAKQDDWHKFVEENINLIGKIIGYVFCQLLLLVAPCATSIFKVDSIEKKGEIET